MRGQTEKDFAERVYQLCRAFWDRWTDFPHAAFRSRDYQVASLLELHLWLARRILTFFEASRLLLMNQYSSEAAVLALAILETATDVLIIGDATAKSEQWWHHQALERAPQPMKRKLDELKASGRGDYWDIYRFYSAIKHGNPVVRSRLYSHRAKLRSSRPGVGRWRDYRQSNRALLESGITTENELKIRWRRRKQARALMKRSAEDERAFQEDVFFVNGMLLADAFATIADVCAKRFGDQTAGIGEWRNAIEESYQVLA